MKGISILNGRYAVTMDLYPQQSEDFNRVYKFYNHLREGRFTTTKCKDCGARSFPPRVICPECLSENLEWVDLPTEGTVKVVTEQVVGVPLGFEAPLIHALIDLDGQLSHFVRVINCQEGELKEGDRVRLVVFPVEPVPVEGKRGAIIEQERVFYAFEKIK